MRQGMMRGHSAQSRFDIKARRKERQKRHHLRSMPHRNHSHNNNNNRPNSMSPLSNFSMRNAPTDSFQNYSQQQQSEERSSKHDRYWRTSHKRQCDDRIEEESNAQGVVCGTKFRTKRSKSLPPRKSLKVYSFIA
ncbi:MAG: hypothetical protein MHMPM18_002426 [Marteilia pararefringens]